MNASECVKKSIYIADEYFNKNNTAPFFESMAEDIVWHGVAIGQKITGLDHMREAWADISSSLSFSIGDIEAEYTQTSPMSCEVMLVYVITTHYPDGKLLPLIQRVQFSWADINYIDELKCRKRISKIFMVHISHPIEYHNDDYLYPDHLNELYEHAEAPIVKPCLYLRGTDNAFYHIKVSSIIWAESTPEQHCLIHLRGKTIKAITTIAQIEKQTEGLLLRIHSSYIINPLDVESIQRFKATLSDGTEIPIPEKKYTSVKKLLLNQKTPVELAPLS